MIVSVVVPTFNRRQSLKRLVEALALQTFPADEFEVVIVSDGSTDGTDDDLRDDRLARRVRPVFQSNSGPAVARNTGVAAARAPLILFLDDDVVPEPTLVEEHVKSHEGSDGRLVVIGPMLTPPDFTMSPWVRWEQAMLEKQYAAMASGEYEAHLRQFYTGNASLARDQILSAGGFSARFRRAEDMELAYRLDAAGARWRFNPRAVTHHYAERTFGAWLQIPRAYGRANVEFARAEGRQWVLDDVASELRRLNALNRAAARLLVGRPRATKALARAVRAGVSVAAKVGGTRAATRVILSGIYNVEYCQGLADGLGGVDRLRALKAAGARVLTDYGEPRPPTR